MAMGDILDADGNGVPGVRCSQRPSVGVTAAALEGAAAAVELVLVMAGALCLGIGRTGADAAQRHGGGTGAACCARCLRRLLPQAGRDEETLAALSANVSANLLGLGNAATPAGIRGRQAHGGGLRRYGKRRAVPPGGAEHRLHPAAALYSGGHAGGTGLRRAAGYPCRRCGCPRWCR